MAAFDLVADPVLAAVHPSIGYVWAYLTLEIGADVLRKRHVFEVAQICVGLIIVAAFAFGHRLSIGILLCENTTEEVLLRRLPTKVERL